MAKTNVKQYFSLSDHAKRLWKYLESSELRAARKGYEKIETAKTRKIKELSAASRKSNNKSNKETKPLVSIADYNKVGKQLETKLRTESLDRKHPTTLNDLISYDTYANGSKSEIGRAAHKHYTDAQIRRLADVYLNTTNAQIRHMAIELNLSSTIASKRRYGVKMMLVAAKLEETMFNFFIAADISTQSMYTLPSQLDAWKKLSALRYEQLKYSQEKIVNSLGITNGEHIEHYSKEAELFRFAIEEAYEQAQKFIDNAYISYEKAYQQYAERNTKNAIARLEKKRTAQKKALLKKIKDFSYGKTQKEELSDEYIREKKYKNMLLELDYAKRQGEAVKALRGWSSPSIDTTLHIQQKKTSALSDREQEILANIQEARIQREKYDSTHSQQMSAAKRRRLIDEANRNEQRAYLSPNIQTVHTEKTESAVLRQIVEEAFDETEQAVLKGKDILHITVDKIMDLLTALTPVDTGNLLQSVNSSYTDNNNAATISFDMHAAPYAVRQHEDTTLTHTNGGAKFLQNAVVGAFTSLPDAQKYLAAKLTIRGYTEALQQMMNATAPADFNVQGRVKEITATHKVTAKQTELEQFTAASMQDNNSLTEFLQAYGPQLSVTLYNRAYYGIRSTSHYNVNNIVRDSEQVQVIDTTIDEILKNNNILNKAFDMVMNEITTHNLRNDSLIDTKLIASLIRNKHFKYKSVENADIAKLYSLISTASNNNDRLTYNGYLASLLVKHGINVTALAYKRGRKET